ncbi:ATP-binding protein [Streptomyces pinistramenti]|uniref:ATP-binding protein n=1 Tax=Streptomyces pinistramenti TaxID=2884812 RepID=UPI001D069E61|nr:ATP-binding protein [Streptomyces pinistramenti]MCB5911881.1 ATP-binding protein [Streptomyces pinistramenti]
MSLPVSRRIARAALLVAASAAPMVAAAGSASAVDLSKASDLGGVTSLDSPQTSETLDHTARDGVDVVNKAGTAATQKLAPALVETAGPVVEKAAPTTQRAAKGAKDLLGHTARHGLSTNTLATDAVKGLASTDAVQGVTHSLPGKGLLGGLPVGG